MKTLFIIMIMICGMSAVAQFSGSYAPANWTFTQNNPPSSGNVNTAGAPASIVLSGDNDNSGGCCDQNVTYGITLCASGTISFNYNHTNSDIDAAFYVINGTRTLITNAGSGSIGPIAVNAGDVFQFMVNSQDDCCGVGVLTITNFVAPSCCTALFTGIYAPANWTFTQNNAPSDGSVNTTGAPGTVILSGDNDNSGGCCDQNVTWGITVPAVPTSISFNYSHVNPDIDNAYYVINGVRTLITSTTSSGTVGPIAIPASGVFQFMVNSQDDCCGRGVLTISNFNACPINCTGTVVGSTITPASGAVCAGGSVTLTGTGASTYTWTGGVTNAVAFVPATTTTYTVTGTTALGCTATSTRVVTVNPLPIVGSTVAPASAAVCAGGSVTLTGTGATTYTWDNSVVDGVAFAPASTLTYNVTGTDVNGCVNTASTMVTVNALPTVTASSSASTVCAGDMVTLTGGGATTYTWDNSVVDAVAFAATATTTYNVTGTDGNGCTNVASTMVTVNALPPVTAASTASAVCAGGMVTLTGGGATTYTWDNSVVDGAAFAPASTLTYNVMGTDVNGCMNTASTMVTVNALPTVTASSTASAVCVGGMVTLTGGGATTYTWDNSVVDGVAFAPASTLTYNVMGTDVNGCMNTASAMVTVNALPTVTASSTASAVCAGGMVTLTGGGATTYTWDNSVVDAAAFAATATTTYNVTGTDVNGCVNTASTTVTVNALPTVTASVNNDTVCAGTMIILTGGGAVSYAWDNGATDGVAFAATDTITYSVTGTDANTCQNTASVNVLVYELPAVTLTSFTAPICLQAVPMALTGGSPTGGVYAGTGVSAGMFDPSVAGVGSFPITYSVTDANACSNSASSNITVQDCTGIDENLASQEVNVYPNPTIGSFTISINNANFSELLISIVNVQGKEVFTSLEKNVNGAYNKNINLENLSKGLYFIKLNSGSEMRVQKLIVQ